METFVNIGFAKISVAAEKIWVALNLGGEGEGGGGGKAASSSPWPVRSWVLSSVSSIKLIIVSVKVDIIEPGL